MTYLFYSPLQSSRAEGSSQTTLEFDACFSLPRLLSTRLIFSACWFLSSQLLRNWCPLLGTQMSNAELIEGRKCCLFCVTLFVPYSKERAKTVNTSTFNWSHLQ